jgi:YbbR domain-containing protein
MLKVRLKEIFLKNIGLKIISILLGVLLWVYVCNEEGAIKNFKIAIRYMGISPNLYISKISTKSISITVQGRRELITSCDSSDFFLSIDLSQKEAGSYIYKIYPHRILGPRNIRIINVYPKRVLLTLKAKKRKEEKGSR